MYYDIIPNIFSNLCWLDVRFIMFYQSVHQSVYPCRIPVIAFTLASIEGRSGARIDFKPMESSFTDEDIHEHIATWAFSGRAPKIGGISWRKKTREKKFGSQNPINHFGTPYSFIIFAILKWWGNAMVS
jgi:hypothetical protein